MKERHGEIQIHRVEVERVDGAARASPRAPGGAEKQRPAELGSQRGHEAGGQRAEGPRTRSEQMRDLGPVLKHEATLAARSQIEKALEGFQRDSPEGPSSTDVQARMAERPTPTAAPGGVSKAVFRIIDNFRESADTQASPHRPEQARPEAHLVAPQEGAALPQPARGHAARFMQHMVPSSARVSPEDEQDILGRLVTLLVSELENADAGLADDPSGFDAEVAAGDPDERGRRGQGRRQRKRSDEGADGESEEEGADLAWLDPETRCAVLYELLDEVHRRQADGRLRAMGNPLLSYPMERRAFGDPAGRHRESARQAQLWYRQIVLLRRMACHPYSSFVVPVGAVAEPRDRAPVVDPWQREEGDDWITARFRGFLQSLRGEESRRWKNRGQSPTPA